MSVLATADVHLNERPSDGYRWRLLEEWLPEQNADELIIAGDLTDAKDRHGAKLVNRLYNAVMGLEPKFRIILVKGNHDYFDVDHPFFQFLGDSSDVVFVTEPVELKLSIGRAFFVPAGVKWDFKIPKVDYLFTHATFSGARAENGRTLAGVDPDVLSSFAGRVYSGDIHVPQTLRRGQIEYIGAPYHTRFGDSFEPRVVSIADGGKATDLYFPAPRKLILWIVSPDDLWEEKGSAGDYVKVRCTLRRAEYDKWPAYSEEIKCICQKREWRLFGAEPVAAELSAPQRDGVRTLAAVKPDALVADYAKRNKAGKEYLEVGQRIVRELRT